MKAGVEKSQVFSIIKQFLKLKGMKYLDLAQQLEMSESGVKKIFQEKNCSLEKLLKICHVLEIQMSELFELTENPLASKHLPVEESLEKVLLQKPRIFYLLRFIQTKNDSKNDLYERGFKDEDFDELKEILVRENIISKSESLFSVRGSCLYFKPGSEMRKFLTRKMVPQIIDKAFDNISEKRKSLEPILWSQALSKTDEDFLRKDILEVLEKYTKRSSLYREHLDEEEHELTYLIVPARFTPGAEEITNLDSF